MNCLSTVGHKSVVPWSTVFLFAVWSLWKNRNNVMFDNTIPNPVLDRVCTSQAKEYVYCLSRVKELAPKVTISISWTKPSPGWHKLNTDGPSLGNPGKAGSGGLIQNCQGNWIKGFSRSIGVTTSVMAELWALRDGLYLTFQLGINILEIELDAKEIVEMINSTDCSNRKHSPLLHDCRSLLAMFTQAWVIHVFREANKCADFLARRGCSMREDFVIFDAPPSANLVNLLVLDVNGRSDMRLVAMTLASVANL